jgi:hypothetical protein
MNKYLILEEQQDKVCNLEIERHNISKDIIFSKTSEELIITDKRIKSLRRKIGYLWNKIEENYKKGLGAEATMKAYDLLERLNKLTGTKRKNFAILGADE